MTEPHQFTLEALTSEADCLIHAGLPEVVRDNLEKIKVAERRAEAIRQNRDRVEKLLADIADRETQLVALRQELLAATLGYVGIRPPAAAAPAA